MTGNKGIELLLMICFFNLNEEIEEDSDLDEEAKK